MIQYFYEESFKFLKTHGFICMKYLTKIINWPFWPLLARYYSLALFGKKPVASEIEDLLGDLAVNSLNAKISPIWQHLSTNINYPTNDCTNIASDTHRPITWRWGEKCAASQSVKVTSRQPPVKHDRTRSIKNRAKSGRQNSDICRATDIWRVPNRSTPDDSPFVASSIINDRAKRHETRRSHGDARTCQPRIPHYLSKCIVASTDRETERAGEGKREWWTDGAASRQGLWQVAPAHRQHFVVHLRYPGVPSIIEGRPPATVPKVEPPFSRLSLSPRPKSIRQGWLFTWWKGNSI